MTGMVLGLLDIFSYVLTAALGQGPSTNNPHLREKEPKTQRGEVTTKGLPAAGTE